MSIAAGWEATEASVGPWTRTEDIDWQTATGPVRPPLVGRYTEAH